MKNLTVLLIALMVATAAQAGKPAPGEIFYTEFGKAGSLGADGPVYGSAYSNPTTDNGTLDNLVFNKPASQVDFNINFGTCLHGNYTATMHLIDGFGSETELVARFWFKDPSDDVGYVLELYDTDFEPESGPAWSGGTFPPFDGSTIIRSAESWEIRTTRKKSTGPCTGSGEFGVPVEFTLELD